MVAGRVDDAGRGGLVARMRELRGRTPRSEFLESLTPEDLKRELEECRLTISRDEAAFSGSALPRLSAEEYLASLGAGE